MHQQRFDYLLHRHFDELLTPAEQQELEQLLLSSPAAREQFWEQARWHGLLRQWGEQELGAPPAVRATTVAGQPERIIAKPIRRIAPVRPAWFWPAAVGALIVFLAGVALIFMSLRGGSLEPRVAMLTHAADVEWLEGGTRFAVGESLSSGWLRLKAGAVGLEFVQGAEMVLEAPAELELISEKKAFLKTGRLRTRVASEAAGFTIGGPGFSVVDLGTEFGCDVSAAGLAEVHVFQGEVKLQTADQSQHERRLRENQAVRLDQGVVEEIPMNLTGYLSVEEIALRELALRRDRFAAWQEARAILSRHPSVLLHLDFERTNIWENSLANCAPGAVAPTDATMVGCTLTDGRWRGKGAAEFSRPTDRLRLDLGTNLSSITLVAWLRVAALPNTQNSLLMTDGFERGEVHWYLYGNGAIGFGVHLENDDPRGWRNFHSDPVITRSRMGQWVCVATTYDGASDRVTHFLNGEALGSHDLGFNGRLLLDQFEIGNWAVQPQDPRWRGVKLRGPRDHIRFFQGRMDEFAVFGSALSEREIRLIYQAGSPNLATELVSVAGGAY